MNVIIAFCGIAAAGWVAPGSEPTAPTQDNVPSQSTYSPQSYPGANNSRQPKPRVGDALPAARPASQAARRPSRMPYAPTDPRAWSNENLPLPPTMNETAYLPSAGTGGPAQRVNPAGMGGMTENGGRHSGSQKSFDRYNPSPSTSPYAMLNRRWHAQHLHGLCPAGPGSTTGQSGRRTSPERGGRRSARTAAFLSARLPELRLVLSHHRPQPLLRYTARDVR
jgi:hypothetical protein